MGFAPSHIPMYSLGLPSQEYIGMLSGTNPMHPQAHDTCLGVALITQVPLPGWCRLTSYLAITSSDTCVGLTGIISSGIYIPSSCRLCTS